MPPDFAAPLRRTCSTEEELRAVAAGFAHTLRAGDVVALRGPLGSGKTLFARAVVAELHGRDAATSPTFTFWQRYRAADAPPIDHLDLYRLEDPRELTELGLEEAFLGDSIVLVEWPERAPALLPARRYEVAIEGAGSAPRAVELRPPQ